MEMLWQILLSAVVGGFIGGYTNYLAIQLLFRPFRPLYFLNWQLPLTPGMIPKQQARLAQSVARTFTRHLFTAEDIRALAQTLVTPENIDGAVDQAVDAILKEFQDTANLHRLAGEVGFLADRLWSRSVTAAADYLAWEGSSSARLVDQVFDYLLAESSLTLEQSNRIADWLLRVVLTPDRVRLTIINALTPDTIAAIDAILRSQIKGRLRFVSFLINFKTLLTQLRDYYEKEPEDANRGIAQLLEAWHVRLAISTYLAEFNPRQIPWQSVEQMRGLVKQFFHTWVVRRSERLVMSVDVKAVMSQAIVQLDPGSIPAEWLANIKQEVAGFVHRYLERDLEHLVQAAIPRLNINGVIIDHIIRFDPAEVERIVLEISRRELNAIVYCGIWLGVLIGGLQPAFAALVRRWWA